jgi:hypothetical protein
MSEREELLDRLKRDAMTEWGAAALSAIHDQETAFAGNTSAGATDTAGNLLRIYRLRQNHCREQGIEARGIAELIATLAGRSEDDVIRVQPFLGSKSSVTAFWDATGNLLGCITILGGDRESGRRNLEFALGKR